MEELMATGAAEGLLRCIFSWAIAARDSEIERRPYHRHCSCALHDPRWCSKPPNARNHTIFYPFRRSLSSTSFALMGSLHTSSSSSSSLLSSEVPVVIKGARPGPSQAESMSTVREYNKSRCYE